MGKRAEHRTIKTISLDKATLEYLEQIAKRRNSNVSNVIELIIKQVQKHPHFLEF